MENEKDSKNKYRFLTGMGFVGVVLGLLVLMVDALGKTIDTNLFILTFACAGICFGFAALSYTDWRIQQLKRTLTEKVAEEALKKQ